MDDQALMKIALAAGFHVESCRDNFGKLKDTVIVKRRGLGVEFVISLYDFRRIVEAALKEQDDKRNRNGQS